MTSILWYFNSQLTYNRIEFESLYNLTLQKSIFVAEKHLLILPWRVDVNLYIRRIKDKAEKGSVYTALVFKI